MEIKTTNPSSNGVSVLLIYTGGTIGMLENPTTKSLEVCDFAYVAEHVQEINQLPFGIDTITFDPPMDSSDAGTDLWQSIARVILKHYHHYDGFVVLHGTDTMAYTASGLSFMFENLNKPVILTGSQVPIGKLRTDGKENLLTALEIAIWCLPYFSAAGNSSSKEMYTIMPALGLPIAVAIAIHNIPEGISVSVPIYYATGKRAKAFWISFGSGLAEPLGAIVGYLLLRPFLTPTLFSLLNALIAGIMVYISLDELLPAAEKYGKHHMAIFGLIAGMAVMAITLLVM